MFSHPYRQTIVPTFLRSFIIIVPREKENGAYAKSRGKQCTMGRFVRAKRSLRPSRRINEALVRINTVNHFKLASWAGRHELETNP